MKLTPNQKRALRHLWKGELTFNEIAEEMEFSPEQLEAVAKSMGLPQRVDPETYLPSREEIRMAAAMIRSEWSQAEREARLASAWSGRLNNATGGDTNAGGVASRRGCEGGETARPAR
jgi:hypothetical protein